LGQLPLQQDGYGTAVAFFGQIQNGAPDGIALVNSAMEVVQFVSYEGTVAATDGWARGMTSTDIGVAESEATPPGASLQMTGFGRSFDDFGWLPVNRPASPGEVNANQDFLAHVFLKIRKIGGDGGTALTGPAFVELQMGAAEEIDLGGSRLKLYSPGAILQDTFVFPASLPLDLGTQRRILVSPGPFDGVAQDVGSGNFTFSGGDAAALCFDNIDCVAWGDFGSTGDLPSPAGTPAPNFAENEALTRSIAPLCPTWLEPGDDTGDSAADFAIGDRTRHNNASPITEVDCNLIFKDGFEP
jgi:hypothetical protein